MGRRIQSRVCVQCGESSKKVKPAADTGQMRCPACMCAYCGNDLVGHPGFGRGRAVKYCSARCSRLHKAVEKRSQKEPPAAKQVGIFGLDGF